MTASDHPWDVRCPGCGEAWPDDAVVACPSCGHTVEDSAQRIADAEPSGPFLGPVAQAQMEWLFGGVRRES